MSVQSPRTAREALLAEVLDEVDSLHRQVLALPDSLVAMEAKLAQTVSVLDQAADNPGLPRIDPVVESSGDVLARLLVRAREAQQSAKLITTLARSVPSRASLPAEQALPRADSTRGLGIVEGWRGTIVQRVEITGGLLSRVKIVDPSFFNWPALPVALRDTIVPDFPLTNKSFNQSYAGNDL